MRHPTFNALFTLMSKMDSPLTIVETGTIRNHLGIYVRGWAFHTSIYEICEGFWR